MGKGILLLVAASVMGGTLLLYQAQRTNFEAGKVQSKHEEKVIAREIARSAYNAASSRARDLDEDGLTAKEIVDVIGGVANPDSGEYQGGTYKYWIEHVAGSTYRVAARGRYGDARYYINNGRTVENLLTVPSDTLCQNGCTLTATFEQSQAGYCSGIYLQRILPDTPADEQPEPEMVFPAGHNDNDRGDVFTSELAPDTQLNFILAVSKNCSDDIENDTTAAYDDSRYDHRRLALEQSTEDLVKLEETNWAIVEEDPNRKGRWRIAFEDRPRTFHDGAVTYTDAKLKDIKKHGYPDPDGDGAYNTGLGDEQWNGKTYDGSGWNMDPNLGGDFLLLEDYSDIPDFSDQVFYVELESAPATPPSGDDGTPADDD